MRIRWILSGWRGDQIVNATTQTGYGVTGVEASEAATTYTSNGLVATVTDAEANRTTYEYDGHDRPAKTRYPSPSTDNTSSTTDYEQLTYATATVGGSTVSTPLVSSQRLRDGNSIAYSYDHLNRVTAKDLPGSELDVAYGYDLMGRMTSAATSAQTLSFTFDALGRNLTQAGPRGTMSYGYDTAGRRTSMTYADSGLAVGYTYDTANDLTVITENPGGTNLALGTYVYDDRGRRTSLSRGNGAVTSYTYDNVDRLTQIAETFVGATTYNRHVDYTLDPAGAIASSTGSSDSYAWTGHYAVNRGYTANGLNQYSAAGSITPTYDSRGNVTSAGSVTYGYSSENRLTSASGGITLTYDPLGRLYQTAGAATTRMGYDGDRMIAEYNSSDTLQRRYVYGPGTDELLVWYEGAGTATPHYYHADERGSVIALSNNSGALTDINAYDEYGIPGTNAGRFQYTGQQWLAELGMYYYRNRIYSPTLGRFMQTDPIGFGGGMNVYAYTQNDPVNFTDPTGLRWEWRCVGEEGKPPNCGLHWVEDSDDSSGGSGDASLLNSHGASRGSLDLGGMTPGSDLVEQLVIVNGTRPQGQLLASPRSLPSHRSSACARALDEPGRIFSMTIGGTLAAGRGLTGALGHFTNMSTGTQGFFYVWGVSTWGGELDVGVMFQGWSSLADMAGRTDTIHIAVDPAQGGLTFTDLLNDPSLVGGTFGGAAGGGISASRTTTTLFGCTLGH